MLFTETSCSIEQQGKTVAEGTRERGLYYLTQAGRRTEEALTVSADIWHRRLGHLGIQNLARASKMMSGIDLKGKTQTTDVCEPCLQGKHSKEPFPRQTGRRGRHLLEIIHTDVCGKLDVPSLSGSEYFVTFLDSASH